MLEEVGAFSIDFPHNWCQPCISHQRKKASSSFWQLILGAVEKTNVSVGNVESSNLHIHGNLFLV